ncbi:cytochrome b [Pseudoalteromonas rubra]|uniref:cytochrome b n=1 Tax=Pseudoalteromonas rubra TaxID=43658 RepID=UPI0013EED7C8|nr:cytochrome b [Pseudoalteromonas rubra]
MKNDNQGYGQVAKVFHWASVFFIIPAMVIGIWWIWVDLDTDSGWEQFEQLIGWHANFGLTVIILMLPRLVWRALNSPTASADSTVHLKKVAFAAHFSLYALALITPISGWLGSALDGVAFSYFSVITIPPIFGTYPDLAVMMTSVHIYASYALIFFIALHLAAVIYHQFWLKDRILRRMT